MRRNELRWERWDAAIASGERPADFLPRISDAVLIQLLAGANRTHRRYDCDLICAELLNRLVRLRDALGEVTNKADHYISQAIDDAEEASLLIHQTVESVETHMDARDDEIAGETAIARTARAATVRVRESLEQADDARERLRALADHTKARADGAER